ncbi:MAG TPA: hypothetical protein DDW52_01530 [Planctomycetaceae bacterium]|nr:hypothetical protein [Planctomycetaceae bacterium]
MIYDESGVLDELYFANAPMRRAGEASADVTLGHRIATDRCNALDLPTPLILSGTERWKLPNVWQRFCGILQRQQIGVYATEQDFPDVEATDLPIRFANIYAGEPITFSDVTSADAVQVNCWQRGSLNARWPSEAGAAQIADYFSAIRAATGNVPLGVGFRVGTSDADVRTAIDAGADYLCIASNERFVSVQHVALLNKMRRACIEADRKEAVIIAELPAARPDEMLKLIAIGASVVALDTMLAPWVPEPAQPEEEESSGLAAALLGSALQSNDPVAESMQRVEADLVSCKERMVDRMAEIAATSVAGLNEQNLRTSSTTLSRLLGVELL